MEGKKKKKEKTVMQSITERLVNIVGAATMAIYHLLLYFLQGGTPKKMPSKMPINDSTKCGIAGV